ncbi:MAG: hypothetical protein Q9196_003149 [Gyalolechia fulgens]
MLTDPKRSLAYPVYRINQRLFWVPATHSDYRTLRSHIDKTDASKTSIEFLKSARLPDRNTPIACIALTMPKAGHEVAKGCGMVMYQRMTAAQWLYMGKPLSITPAGSTERTLVRPNNITVKQEPDDSYSVTGEKYPFLVLEVRDGQSKKDLKRKLHRWLNYTNNKVKIVCVFEVEPGSAGGYRILASVIKAKKRPAPTPQAPNRHRLERVFVHDRVDISSQEHPGTFTISAAEVYPEEWPLDPAAKDNYLTITLASLHAVALIAVNEKVAEVARDAKEGGPSPYNSDQEAVSTPSSSNSMEEEWHSGGEPDDELDLTYEE